MDNSVTFIKIYEFADKNQFAWEKTEYLENVSLRKFVTVEKRAKQKLSSSYVPLPSNEVFARSLLHGLGLQGNTSEFYKSRDNADKQVQLPVMEVKTSEGDLWPVLVLDHHGVLYCCLPLVENIYEGRKPSLLTLPSVSVGFSVLLSLTNFTGPVYSTMKEASMPKCYEIESFITLSMPFGQPSDTEWQTVYDLQTVQNEPTSKMDHKQPAWKPHNYKGKSTLNISISEYVRSVQFDQPWFQDVTEVFGNVIVKAMMEGVETDVILSLSHVQPGHQLQLESLILHPCVQASVLDVDTNSSERPGMAKKLRFSPPLHEFVLCQYKVKYNKLAPIIGVYKVRGEQTVEFLLQLKLLEGVRNAFDTCEVLLPFLHRGVIQRHEVRASQGNVKEGDNRNCLIWSLGNKFSSKTLEASLMGTIYFECTPCPQSYGESFLKGGSAYVQVKFKCVDYTISGCVIDPKNIQVNPPHKPKISAERFVSSTDFKIWNCFGDVPFSSVR
ncbi:AP-5 complex subunit mu-1-like isoform X2 [Tachypleus tridentatus]|uniref:AP-5 complex subunit mu-1-like isoform X2 n=1 Tax=Tachypleus tridentatus TaxID=6853 RepID=UPI003FD058A3